MENVSELLRQHDIKPSFTRVMIYEYLKNHLDHPTVEDIFSSLQSSLPTLSKTTVYNTLNLFIDKHLVQPLVMNQQKHYDLITDPHAHFKCERCDTIYDLDIKPPKLNHELAENYHVYGTQLIYRGVCIKCQKHAA